MISNSGMHVCFKVSSGMATAFSAIYLCRQRRRYPEYFCGEGSILRALVGRLQLFQIPHDFSDGSSQVPRSKQIERPRMKRFDDPLNLIEYIIIVETESQVVIRAAAIALYL